MGAGSDYIRNDNSNVIINAGAGDDSISLNSGASLNVIEYTSGDGFDSISGFKSTDTLSISGGSYSTQKSGKNIIVTVGLGKLTLVGAASLSAVNIDGIYNDTPSLITLTEDDDTIENYLNGATIAALGGNDSIRNEGDNVSISGGTGNDTIRNDATTEWNSSTRTHEKIESPDNVTLLGDEGDDWISNEGDSVTIDGGEGEDSIHNRGGNYVTINAGAGNDYVDTSWGDGSNVSVNAGAGDDTISSAGNLATVYGGAGDDSIYLRATSGLVQYSSGDGNDTIIGFNESDTLTITGDSYTTELDGNDVIVRVGEGSVRLVGAKGKDLKINKIDSTEIITLTEDDDELYNYLGNVTIYGYAGKDYIYNLEGENVTIDAGAGDDHIRNESSNVTIDGGAGDDVINSYENSNVSINGGEGNDRIDSYNDSDSVTIDGGAGDDTIVNNGDNVSINAGTGNDEIRNDYSSNVTIDAGAGNDTIRNSESSNVTINAGAGNDYIGNYGSDVTINAGKGNDEIFNNSYRQPDGTIYYNNNSLGADVLFKYTWGDGDDSIYGFKESSTLQIGSGSGTYSTQTSGDDVIVNVGSGSILLKDAASLASVNIDGIYNDNPLLIMLTENDDSYSNTLDNATILALGGNDSVTNSGANVSIDGGAGDDYILNNSGMRVSINSGSGNDYIFSNGWYASIDGGDGDDFIVSDFTNSFATINGGFGNDSIYNDGSHVSIHAGAGNDSIENSYSSDVTINAGADDDLISLGSDASLNLIEYASGDGNDSIYGLKETDTLNISGGDYSIHALNSDIIVTVDDGSVMLKGATSLTSFNINDEAITVEDVYYALTLPDGVTTNVANATDKFEFNDKTYYKGGAELTFTAPEGSYFKVDDKLISTENYTMPAADTTLTADDLNLFTPPTITGLNFVVDSEGNGYYEISNADELVALATYSYGYIYIDGKGNVNNMSICAGLTFKVVADIDLKGITNLKSIYNLRGTFDGQGYTISNLTLGPNYYSGLFSYSYGTIKNVNLKNVNIVKNYSYGTGGLVDNNYGTVKNCSVTGIVSAGVAGGVVGENNGTVTDCSFSGKVNTNYELKQGGLVGLNKGRINGTNTVNVTFNGNSTHVGGLVGENKGGTISGINIVNAQIIAGSSSCYYIGGLVGLLSSGTINGTNTVNGTIKGDSDYSFYVGGLVGYASGGTTISGTNTVIGTVSGNDKVGGLVGQNYATISADNKVDVQVKGNENVSGLVGKNESSGKLTGTNYYHSNKDAGGIGIRVYSADASGITVSGGEPIQIGEKNFYEAGTELTLTINDGLAVKGATNGTYTVSDHDLADDIYYAIIPPAGYEYLSGDEYNGYYRGEVVFKPKAGYLGENITRTISEPNQTLEGGTLTLDSENRYVFKNADETYALATAQNVVEKNYPDLTQVYKVTVPDDMTVQGSEVYTVDGTIYCKSGSTITVAGNEYTVNSDMTFIKEIEAAGWTFSDSVASYKSAKTTISYTLDDNESHHASTSGGETLLTVSGVKSIDGLSLNDKTVTVGNDSLNKATVTISEGYTLELADDVKKSSIASAGWTLDGAIASYKNSSTSEGYSLDDNKINYVPSSGGETLLTVSGVKSIDGLSLNGTTVTVGDASLNKETVTISDGYTLALGNDVTKTSTSAAGWILDGAIAYYKNSSTSEGYTLDDNQINYVPSSGGETLATVSGVKSLDGLSLNGKTVTVGNDSLNKATVTISDGYTLALGNDVTKTSTSAAGWILDGAIAYYKNSSTSEGYTLDDNKINYVPSSGGETLLTVSGVKSLDGLNLNDKTVTVGDASLNKEKVTISDGYTLELADDVTKTLTTAAGWTLNKDVAIYKTESGSAGYNVINNQIVYSEEITGSPQIILNGVAENASLPNPVDKAITLNSTVLGANTSLKSNDGAYIVELTGDMNNKTFSGSDEDDTVNIAADNAAVMGGAGNDTLTGGAGNDSLWGDAGNDFFIYEAGNDVIEDYTAGQDTIKIAKGKISKTSFSGSDVIFTIGTGTLTVKNAIGKTISLIDSDGKASSTVVGSKTSTNNQNYKRSSSSVPSSRKKDIFNFKTSVSVKGSAGDDVIWNYGNLVTIFGGNGNDTIRNSGANVTIISGRGNDQISLSSGAKNNLIEYNAGDGHDTIWGVGADSSIKINAPYSIHRVGNNIVVEIQGGSNTNRDSNTAYGSITLMNVDHSIMPRFIQGESGTSGGGSSSGSGSSGGSGGGSSSGNGNSSGNGGNTTGGTSASEGKGSDASGGKSSSGSSGNAASNNNASNGNGSSSSNYTKKDSSDTAPEWISQNSNSNTQSTDMELDETRISTTTSQPYPIHHIYRGNDQVISNYQSGENILFAETYTGATFDDKGNFFAYSSTGTLVIENATNKFISINDSNAYAYLKFYAATTPGVIDGRGLEGFEILNGSDGPDKIYAGDGNSQLWGGNGFVSDTLIGGGGKDIFIGSKNQGEDFFLNVSASDEIQLSDVTLNDIMKIEKNDDEITFFFKTGGSVMIQSSEAESATIVFADTTWHFKHSP